MAIQSAFGDNECSSPWILSLKIKIGHIRVTSNHVAILNLAEAFAQNERNSKSSYVTFMGKVADVLAKAHLGTYGKCPKQYLCILNPASSRV